MAVKLLNVHISDGEARDCCVRCSFVVGCENVKQVLSRLPSHI